MRTALLILFTAVVFFFAGSATNYFKENRTSLPQVGIGGAPENSLPLNSSVEDIVEHANPSVVTIALTAEIPDIRRGRTRIVEGNIGTGFILRDDGYIVTNKHVVSLPADSYTVVLNEQEEYKVEEIFTDPDNDIAILKINASGLRPLALGDSSTVRLGQPAISIGTTLGEFTNTVTTGVISGLDRNITVGSYYESEDLKNLIQTDAAINPGNSGGPLLNSNGQVVGISTAIAGGAENVGFAIPIDTLKEFARSRNILA